MHILFVHQNYPAQFGHVARHLVRAKGWRCSFVSKTPPGNHEGVEKIEYKTKGGARDSNHYCSRTFENAIWHSHGVFEACKAATGLRPDLIVGHSGFGSTAFLPELFPGVPIINYFEYFYHTTNSDIDFRPEFPTTELDRLRARARNATLLLDLQTCERGYSPTRFQQGLFPAPYRPKIDVIFDGIETEVYARRSGVARKVAGVDVPQGTRIVTYVSRGFESMRGFDVFMKVARRIYEQFPNVLFVCVGSDRICYGGDEKHIKHKSFREHVLAQDSYDLSKFVFTGMVPVSTLVDLFSLSDLHVYLTVPFVLSWSLMDALACGCPVLASDTPPVAEMIRDGENGRLAGFFDVEGMAAKGVEVLRRPDDFRHLGANAERTIRERYALDVTLPRLVSLFEETAGKGEG